jgi:hypothetical protein
LRLRKNTSVISVEVLLALLLDWIKFCLSEWSNGTHWNRWGTNMCN